MQYFSKILSQLSNVTLLEMTSPVTFDWILSSLSPTLDTVKYMAIKNMFALTCYHDKELLVTIDEPLRPDSLEKALCNCKEFRTYSSVYLFDNSCTISLRQDFSLFFHETLNKFSVCSLIRLKSYHNVDPTVPYYPALTHLTLKDVHLDTSSIEALGEAVKEGKLPSLSYLSLINCSGIYDNLEVLFKVPWSALTSVNLYGSRLSPLDFKTLGLCRAEVDVLPKLNELSLSVDSFYNSLPYLFHDSSFGCRLSSLYLHVYEKENFCDSEKSVSGELSCLTLPNIKQFGVRGSSALVDKMSHALQSLVMRNAFQGSDQFERIRCINVCELNLLDISHNLGVSGNLSVLFSQPLLFLGTLVLKDCRLNPGDMRSLVEAQRGNRMPALKHLDVSDNELLHSDLACLFEGSCTWAQLLSLDVSGNAFHILLALDSPVVLGLLPVLEDVTASRYILHKITTQWQHLKTLRVLRFYEPSLEAVADARSNGKLPALLNVCIHTTELRSIRGVSRLAEMGVSCHTFVGPDCPFRAYQCVLCNKGEDE